MAKDKVLYLDVLTRTYGEGDRNIIVLTDVRSLDIDVSKPLGNSNLPSRKSENVCEGCGRVSPEDLPRHHRGQYPAEDVDVCNITTNGREKIADTGVSCPFKIKI